MRINRRKRFELAVALAAALTVMVMAAGTDAWHAPSTGAEVRHGSGIVLLGPEDYPRLFAKWKMTERLDRVYNQVRILSDRYRGDFGYPWLHSEREEVVIRVVNERGEGIARAWIDSGTEIPVRLEKVDRSIEQLQRVLETMGPGLADVPGANRIFQGAPDHERNRIVFSTDRVNDAMLRALVVRFGTEAVAVRIERNPFFRHV